MVTMTDNDVVPEAAASRRLVITAASLGTIFEWYDFYIYGALAVFFGALFFPPGNDTAAFLASLATFGAGFAVRPLGALVFGRLGDMVGRKYTFLVTILIMGLSTAAVGLLPTYAEVGLLAPVLLVGLRLLQGLAIGGEYGGAAIYVAEHAPDHLRGRHTSWIQTTSTVGLLLSLGVILVCRQTMDAASFAAWGWRIPFILSVALLGISVYIRLRLEESPVFAAMKRTGAVSRAPFRDSFGNWTNLSRILVALFGATAGQAVVWYTGQFYALYFLTATLKLDYVNAYLLIALALVAGTPLYILFGALSDRIGRKPLIVGGFLLAALTYFPLFHALTAAVNPALDTAQRNSPVTVAAHDCNVNVFAKPVTSCDLARDFLSKAGVTYVSIPTTDPAGVVVRIGVAEIRGYDATAYAAALAAAGYPKATDPSQIRWVPATLLLTVMMVWATMVYGPMAAFLVELFPARIRYTSLSLPFHVGNGLFGGFLPFVAFAVVVVTGDPYAGLWYPVGVAVVSFVVGLLFIRDRTGCRVAD
ncbi:MFS transporter [Bradyrhizobium elkanii]|uniref:MFS family permease n=1 Tax=Bradyrhizobium elkanii TaxID=29448 RepID=A0ABV4EWG9_BRAEL|nr:MFS transporter [Bradyrhizobium elkanii]MBP2427991.1 MFS family permease [Bradyrhizobium elkanii]MCP1756523.1 MFS family permease [Bradyrhizobium elkanii]MCP1971187.1 MFS family permease [Bradyrhizobium elkanii]MCP1982036.1 MFS family permease [Bradyrhizobium elkanii]MCS3883180.1 MFS family permease [Bradyrhizobium elkanii]